MLQLRVELAEVTAAEWQERQQANCYLQLAANACEAHDMQVKEASFRRAAAVAAQLTLSSKLTSLAAADAGVSSTAAGKVKSIDDNCAAWVAAGHGSSDDFRAALFEVSTRAAERAAAKAVAQNHFMPLADGPA